MADSIGLNKKLVGSHPSVKKQIKFIVVIVLTFLAIRAFTNFYCAWGGVRPEHDFGLSNTNHIIAQNEHTPCDLVMDSSNTEWRNYTQAEESDIKQVAVCLDKISRSGGSLNGAIGEEEPIRKLQCPTKVTLATVRNTIKQYDTVWFGGDSVLEQQFCTLACMLDQSIFDGVDLPSFTNPMVNYSLFWHHTTNHSNHSTTGTTLLYSKFGWIFDTNEHALYRGDFPTAIQRLGSNDAIILDAAYHYDSSRVHLLANAVKHIANLSTHAMASVFYMEPAMEEWPTSNGLYTQSCMWRCRCEFVDSLRLIGRGNYSHPSANRSNDFSFQLPTPPDIDDWLIRLYPNSTHGIQTEDCLPDCLPATWRMDLARAILNETEHNLTLVPLFWQMHAKRAPSGRMPVGDCTHKSLDTVMMMNEQLILSMRKDVRLSSHGVNGL